jgi:hypothetical protein
MARDPNGEAIQLKPATLQRGRYPKGFRTMTAFNIETATVAELRSIASRLAIAGRSRMNKAALQAAIATAQARLEQLAEASQEIGALVDEGLQALGYAAADAVEFVSEAIQSEEAKALAVKALKGAKVVGYGLMLVSMAALMALLYLGLAFQWAYHLCERWDSFADVEPKPDPVLEAAADALAIAQVLLELLVSRLYGGWAQGVAKVKAWGGAFAGQQY